MLKKRLIPVLILRQGQVVQSVRFNHTNVIHWNPVTAVDFFNTWAVDEIILLDVSRNLEERDKFYEAVDRLSKKCFVPLSVGGWIFETQEVNKILRLGADKIIINTQAFLDPQFINDCARIYGSQCVVVSIDVKIQDNGHYEVFIDRGRKQTGASPVEWAKKAQELGAGEIFLTTIDNDGARNGYDLELTRSVSEAVTVPVIASGGVGEWNHLVEGVNIGKADAVSVANKFHFIEHSTKIAKDFMDDAGVDVRETVFYKLHMPRIPKYEI